MDFLPSSRCDRSFTVLCSCGLSGSHVELYQNIKMSHDLTVDHMFCGLADNTDQADCSLVGLVGLTTHFRDSCDIGVLPIQGNLASVV